MKRRDPPKWAWKAPDQGDDPVLLYEPGNWGDVLKGSWALLVLRALLEDGNARPLRYVDPCAGQPTYPLVNAAARRLERLRGRVFAAAQASFAGAGCLASTGLLVRDGCAGAGVECALNVFDVDASRLRAWEKLDGVQTLQITSGEGSLDLVPRADFILVDPYDFFDHWGRWLSGAAQAARRSLVLIYLYNKAPRGRGYLEQYQRLRSRLESIVDDEVGAFLGRIASDTVLPRAYHEVVLLGPPRRLQPLKEALTAETRELSRIVAEDGAFEEIGGG